MYRVCCKILGVEPGSGTEDIKKAYRTRAKILHPDTNSAPEAHHHFLMLNRAYEYLIQYNKLVDDIKSSTNIDVHVDLQKKERKYYGYRRSYTGFYTPSYRHINILDSFIGRIVFIFFHLAFLFIGTVMIIKSLAGLMHVEVHNNLLFISPVFTAVFSMAIGTGIIIIFILSGLRLFSSSSRNI